MKPSIADLRRNYTRDGLVEDQAPDEPLSLFATWFEQAVTIESTEANAMMLATVDAGGQPHLRTLLLKGVDDRGQLSECQGRATQGPAAGGHDLLVA